MSTSIENGVSCGCHSETDDIYTTTAQHHTRLKQLFLALISANNETINAEKYVIIESIRSHIYSFTVLVLTVCAREWINDLWV